MKRDWMPYFMSGLALLTLVAFAFLGPHILFQIQDAYRMGNIEIETLGEMDAAALSVSYEDSICERLTAYSKGVARGEKYFVAETDYLDKADSEDRSVISLLGELENKHYYWMDSLLQMGNPVMSILYSESIYAVNKWKQYVVYEENFSEGVAFMMWYLDLVMSDGSRMRILMDTEDYTIYGIYVAIGRNEEINQLFAEERENRMYLNTDLLYAMGDMYDIYSAQSIAEPYLEEAKEQISDTGSSVILGNEGNETTASYVDIETMIKVGQSITDQGIRTSFQLLYEEPLTLNYIIREDREGAVSYWGFDEIVRLIPEMQDVLTQTAE